MYIVYCPVTCVEAPVSSCRGSRRRQPTPPHSRSSNRVKQETARPSQFPQDAHLSPRDQGFEHLPRLLCRVADVSRGNCWLSVEGILSFGHRPAQHRASYATRGIASPKNGWFFAKVFALSRTTRAISRTRSTWQT